MGVKKALEKGVAIATLIGAAVALAHALKKNKKAKLLKTAAEDAKEHVLAHAKKLGGVSKAAYGKIVDAVLSEYAHMKAFSKKEAADLAVELKENWQATGKALKSKKR